MKKIFTMILVSVFSALCIYNYLPDNIFNRNIEIYNEASGYTSQLLTSKNKTIEVPESYLSQSEELIEFIEENLQLISSEYYKETGLLFDAKYIEKTAVVLILVEDIFATYIDFNNDNGYMVVTPDYALYEFETTGDLKFLKDKDLIFYSTSNGFKYFDDNTLELKDYEQDKNSNKLYDIVLGDPYAGQEREGDGYIYDAEAYVNARYPEYNLVDSFRIYNHQKISQFDTSIYVKHDGLTVSSEGNCCLNAMYSMLNGWQKQGFCPNLPTSKQVVQYDPIQNEPNHNSIINAGWVVNDLNLMAKSAAKINGEKAIDNIPLLYSELRQTLYDKGYTYDIEGGVYNPISAIIYVIKDVLYDYGYDCDIDNIGSDISVMEFHMITNEAAQMIYVQNSSSYGSHAMACVGYKKYQYTTGWWIFSTTHTEYLIEVDDGHSTGLYNSGYSIWYDPNGSSNSIEKFIACDTVNPYF